MKNKKENKPVKVAAKEETTAPAKGQDGFPPAQANTGRGQVMFEISQ